jgi:hypothetical protein
MEESWKKRKKDLRIERQIKEERETKRLWYVRCADAYGSPL